MVRKLNSLTRFRRDVSGAVTVDWVVLSAAVLAMCLAVFASMGSSATGLGDKIAEVLGATDVATARSGSGTNAASHYFDVGIAASPDDRTEAWRQARMAAQDDAPDGFNYDPEFDETRYVDAATGMLVYESNDGSSYSIGGEVVSAADYDPASNGSSFQSTFNGYWGS